jgi:polar amino acid transport system permease protein
VSVATGTGPGVAPIVLQMEEARRRTRFRFRVFFILTWIVLIALLVVPLAVRGSLKLPFLQEWWAFILGGAFTTVVVSIASIALAVVLAILGALGRLSANPVIYGVASLYVSLIRGTPLLVQVLFWYLGLAELGLVLDPLLAGVFALAFNYGAYMTEIFRAGIQAVPKGQREAAQALGMPESLLMRRVVLPQAFRIVIPAIGNDFISMIKDTSLISVIAVPELLWKAQAAGRPNIAVFPALMFAALVYWGLTIIFSFFQERLERRLARSDR